MLTVTFLLQWEFSWAELIKSVHGMFEGIWHTALVYYSVNNSVAWFFLCVVFFNVHIKPCVHAYNTFYLFHPFNYRQMRRGTIISSINCALLLICQSLKPLNSVSGTPLNTQHISFSFVKNNSWELNLTKSFLVKRLSQGRKIIKEKKIEI